MPVVVLGRRRGNDIASVLKVKRGHTLIPARRERKSENEEKKERERGIRKKTDPEPASIRRWR
ncbi:hypothetical protein Hdeb2414_s0745g00942161 [Helianthus debilis subsp. tardiflorus]